MNGNGLRVDSLDVRYGDARAVDNVSFSIDSGQCLAILGANAAGKSSIAKSIVGVVRPTKGAIEVGGQDVVGLAPHLIARAGIGYLPEGRGIFPSLTVAENVRLGLGLISQAKRESAEQRLFDQFPALASRRGQVAGTLSGGEQQMLAMGRALVTEPRLLVIDELSLGLAPFIIDSIYESLRVAREQGVTILLVEQYIDRALAMADRVVLMQRGVVEWEGTAEEGKARLAGGYL